MNNEDFIARRTESFEYQFNHKLLDDAPIMIRVICRNFDLFNKEKPYDKLFTKWMQDTMKVLCEHFSIAGCRLGYTFSNEIILLLRNTDSSSNIKTYLNYSIQNISSLCASLATSAFYKSYYESIYKDLSRDIHKPITREIRIEKINVIFTVSCFNIPHAGINGYFSSKQQDAIRRSIVDLGDTYLCYDNSDDWDSEVIKQNVSSIHGINWDDFPNDYKLGSCCIKKLNSVSDTEYNTEWVIDHNIPLFKDDEGNYIDNNSF